MDKFSSFGKNDNLYFPLTLKMDIRVELLSKLSDEKKESFIKQFHNSIKDKIDISIDKIDNNFINDFFESRVVNPISQINELKRVFLGDNHYINLQVKQNLETNRFLQVDKYFLNELQKWISNHVIFGIPIDVHAVHNSQSYHIRSLKDVLGDKIEITNDWKIYELAINSSDKNLDNIVNITKSIKSHFFDDVFISNENEMRKILSHNKVLNLRYLSWIVTPEQFKKDYREYNNYFNAVVNIQYYETFGQYLWVEMKLPNNALFIEEGKITFDVVSWWISSGFISFDTYEEFIKYLNRIDDNNQLLKNENRVNSERYKYEMYV